MHRIEQKIIDHLKTVRPEQWDELFKLLNVVRAYNDLPQHIEWNGEPVPKDISTWSKRQIERYILNYFYALGLVPSIPTEHYSEVRELREHGVAYRDFSTVQLVATTTLMARTDHHNGSFDSFFEDNNVLELLEELQRRVKIGFG